jgi:hypothetical protein
VHSKLALRLLVLLFLCSCSREPPSPEDDAGPNTHVAEPAETQGHARTVWATATGLDGETLKLSLDGRYVLQLTSDGRQPFPAQLEEGQAFQVSIDTLPVSHACELQGASGVVGTQDVEVEVRCGVDDTRLATLALHTADARLEPTFAPNVRAYVLDAYATNDVAWLEAKTVHPAASLRLRYRGEDLARADGIVPLALSDAEQSLELEVHTPWGRSERTLVRIRRRDEPALRSALESTSPLNAHANFAGAVALSRSYVAIGSSEADSEGLEVARAIGRVDIYRRTPDGWLPDGTLLPSGQHEPVRYGVRFGSAVAFAGEQLLVGAPDYTELSSETSDFVSGRGAVFVFERRDEGWVEVQRLRPSPTFQDYFGRVLASDGKVLAVTNSHAFPDPDSVEVFHKQATDGRWTYQQTLYGDADMDTFSFGHALAIDGDHLVVGAPLERAAAGLDDDAAPTGGVYLFVERDGAWQREHRVATPSQRKSSRFGTSVALAGDLLVVGAPYDGPGPDDDIEFGSGAAHVYRKSEHSWRLSQTLYPEHAPVSEGPAAEFGAGVTIFTDSVWVSAPYAVPQAAAPAHSGAVFRYARSAQHELGLAAPLPFSGSVEYARFGAPIAVGPDGVIAIGELVGRRSPDKDVGVVYLLH